MTHDIILSLKEITKTFPGVIANDHIYKEINLVGNFGFSSKYFGAAYKMVSQTPELFGKLISKRYKLKDIKAIFYDVYEKKQIKVVINF